MKTNLMGIVAGIPNADYHAMTNYISSTGLREFAKSPAHYQAYITAKREPTAAMSFGTNFHELIGEPELFAKKYTKGPRKEDYKDLAVTAEDIHILLKEAGYTATIPRKKPDAAKLLRGLRPEANIWDDIKARFEDANKGKTVLDAEDYDRLDGMLYSLIKSKTALNLFTNGVAEQSVFWKDPKTGVLCRCRPDYLRNDGIVVDLKTTEDASPRGFKKSVRNYNYDLTSQFYLRGVSEALHEPLNDFIHCAVEKKAPYGVGLFTLSDAYLLRADQQIETLLESFAECTAKNEWPAYPDSIQNLDPEY